MMDRIRARHRLHTLSIVVALTLGTAGCLGAWSDEVPRALFDVAADAQGTSFAWPVLSGAMDYHVDITYWPDESTGFFLVNLGRDHMSVLLDGIEGDASHVGRGPAPVAAGVGDLQVESPGLLRLGEGKVVGPVHDVPLHEGHVVACWGRGVQDARINGTVPGASTAARSGDARSWALKDFGGGVRGRAGPVTAGDGGRLDVGGAHPALITAVVYASDQSSGWLTVTTGQQSKTIRFEPSALAPTLMRHQVLLYTTEPATVTASIAGENGETKVFVNECRLPRLFDGPVWHASERAVP